MGKSILLLTSFIGALPAMGAEEDDDAESPWDSEVLSLKNMRIAIRGIWEEGRSMTQKNLRACFFSWTLPLLRLISFSCFCHMYVVGIPLNTSALGQRFS